MSHRLAFFFLCALSGCAEENTVLDRLLRKLESEEFSVREAAQSEIVKHYKERPSEGWSIGKRILVARGNAELDVSSRLDRVLKEISVLEKSDHGYIRTVTPSDSDLIANIEGIPSIVIAITSDEMLRYYRPIAQSGTHQGIPEVDFKYKFLFGIFTTSFTMGDSNAYITKHSFSRNFDKHLAECHVTLQKGPPGDTTGGLFPGVVGINYEILRTDLPILVTHTSENVKQGFLVKLTEDNVRWDEVESVLKDRNIFAFRKLAEGCEEVPAKVRRDFLQKGYMIDPLLPYVLFTHLAKKYPDLFLQDYEYWKDKAPDSAVVGALFRAALERGKEIVEQKGRKIETPKAP